MLSCGTKCGKVQYQATKDADANALERHIPWLNSTPTETCQNQISISSSFRYKDLALIRISTSRKVKASLFYCVLIYRSIYRLLAKHPASWFKHMTTGTKDAVPVLSPLKMFQLPTSNPSSY